MEYKGKQRGINGWFNKRDVLNEGLVYYWNVQNAFGISYK